MKVYIGFGSNLGNSAAICRRAIVLLAKNPAVSVKRVSSLYKTEPEGITDQPWFVNGVLECETDLAPEELLDVLHEIEKQFGRSRDERWGPRTLDLDILSYGGLQMRGPRLTIPHPRMHERRFVLVPLLEIAPDWIHPSLKVSAGTLLDELDERQANKEVQLLKIR